MRLDRAAALAAVQALADQLGLPLLDAAEGVVAVLNSNMANAIRARTVQKGIDPRDYALVAFGGAGPLHGAEVAQMLGIPEVVVPPLSGHHLGDRPPHDGPEVRPRAHGLPRLDRHGPRAHERATSRRWKASLRAQLAADGARCVDGELPARRRCALCRPGLRAPPRVAGRRIGTDELAAALASFHQLHEREYGHHFAQSPVELVNLRVTAVAQVPKIRMPPKPAGGSLAAARMRTDKVVFRVGVELRAVRDDFLRPRQAAGRRAVRGAGHHPAGRFDDGRAAAAARPKSTNPVPSFSDCLSTVSEWSSDVHREVHVDPGPRSRWSRCRPLPGRAVAQQSALEEVVVTATRRTERLQDVATSAAVFSAEDLQALRVLQPLDLAEQTPGCSPSTARTALRPSASTSAASASTTSPARSTPRSASTSTKCSSRRRTC